MVETSPSAVLELGTYCGYSTVRISRLLPQATRLFTVEMNPECAHVARQVISHAGLQDKVRAQCYLSGFGSTSSLLSFMRPALYMWIFKVCVDSFQSVGGAPQVCLLEGESSELIPKMAQTFGIQTFDFVFLDHWKEFYLRDLRLLEVKLPGLIHLTCVCPPKRVYAHRTL